jgi:hypothetical protein
MLILLGEYSVPADYPLYHLLDSPHAASCLANSSFVYLGANSDTPQFVSTERRAHAATSPTVMSGGQSLVDRRVTSYRQYKQLPLCLSFTAG